MGDGLPLEASSQTIKEITRVPVLSVVFQGASQAGLGDDPVLLSQIDEGRVVVDHHRFGPEIQCPTEVGERLGEAPCLMVQDAAIQGGRGQPGIELEGAIVVVEVSVGLAQRRKGQGPIIEALRGPGCQGNADAKGVDRVPMTLQLMDIPQSVYDA
jgi:hypothetical protein